MGSIPNHKLLTTTLRPWKEFWAGGYVSKFTSSFFLSCCKCFLAFGLNFCFGLWFLKNSEKDAQICIYDASWDTYFGFCCDIDEETSRELAGKFL